MTLVIPYQSNWQWVKINCEGACLSECSSLVSVCRNLVKKKLHENNLLRKTVKNLGLTVLIINAVERSENPGVPVVIRWA